MTFNEGDVIAYKSNMEFDCEGVVHHHSGEKLECKAVRIVDQPWTIYEPPALMAADIYDVHLHPDPDAVWVDLCAAHLRGEYDEEVGGI